MPLLIRNIGKKLFLQLEQYNTLTGISTGVVKPNSSLDPDYIPPFDSPSCPTTEERVETTTTTTTSTSTTTTTLPGGYYYIAKKSICGVPCGTFLPGTFIIRSSTPLTEVWYSDGIHAYTFNSVSWINSLTTPQIYDIDFSTPFGTSNASCEIACYG